jgi:triphosphatase
MIKRITQRLNPRVARVVALPAPNDRERTQWYFQRYVPHLPAAGVDRQQADAGRCRSSAERDEGADLWNRGDGTRQATNRVKDQQTEIELKFLVPPGAREGVIAELARGSATQRISLGAMYLDTEDRRLARAGLAWRLRREGRRWVQTLKASGAHPLERFEHEVARPSTRTPTPDASAHAGTGPGDALLELLRRAHADGFEPVVRFRTEVRRTMRRISTRGAVVEIAFDEGRIVVGNGGAQLRVHEIEFELVSGTPAAMLALAERWRKRFGLVVDLRSKSERGDRLADGTPYPPVRKADRPGYRSDATFIEAFGSVVDECLAQITRNAIGLIEGDAASSVEHVHQLRVGIRRLRSALRTFRGWVLAPPDELLDGLRSLFAELGVARDTDVLGSGVAAELAAAGAPPLTLPPGPAGVDPADAVASTDTQRMLLAWLTWRASLAAMASKEVPASDRDVTAGTGEAHAKHPDAHHDPEPDDVAHPFRRSAALRLRRWHKRIAADSKAFDDLDDNALHALRKRIKRQRYAVEFLAPAQRRREVERYLEALAAIQDRMGALNDLFVARARYQAMATTEPAAWFALGWLAARIAELRALARPELARLAKTDPPTPRGGEP